MKLRSTFDPPAQNNMKTDRSTSAVTTAGATALASTVTAAAALNVEDLVSRIGSHDDKVRGPAWQKAGPLGAPAVKPLVGLMTDSHPEVARSAKRGLYQIIRYAGRPGADSEARAVESQLVPALDHPKEQIRRDILWMLSEIGGEASVEPIAKLLVDRAVRDDARMALQRIPGDESLAALRNALKRAPDDFKYNLAEALAKRGHPVKQYPSRKLVPTRQTRLQTK
jgi:HEAT repeat protein